MRRSITYFLIAASALTMVGCGVNTPTKPKKTSSKQTAYTMPPTGQMPGITDGMPGVPGAQNPMVAQILAGIQQMRDTSSTADLTIKLTYYKDNGGTATCKSRIKFQKPQRNYIEILQSSDDKSTGTKLVWTGGDKLQVRTKFIGFWVTTSIDLHDERASDQRGYFIDETSLTRSLDTIMHPQAQVSYLGESALQGKPMSMLEIVSPLKLKGVTKEIYGIDRAINQPILREMYKGTKVIWRMTVESAKVNPTFSAKDFSVE